MFKVLLNHFISREEIYSDLKEYLEHRGVER